MKTALFFCIVSLTASSALRAETNKTSNSSADAAQVRADLVSSLVKGIDSADSGLDRLKSLASPSGLNVDHDADVAFAAIDVGQRLLVERKPAIAEIFFREADRSLTAVIERTSDQSARDKAQYLSARAHVRAKFLGQVTDARADIDAALALQPDDAYLKQLNWTLGGKEATAFKSQALAGKEIRP